MRPPASISRLIFPLLFFILLFGGMGFWGPGSPGSITLAAAIEKTEVPPGTSPAKEKPTDRATKPDISLAWAEFAHGISEITAAAVSPLLVVSVIGANRYLRSTESERARLPFFCNPLLWGTGLALLVICFLKDAVGPALPPLLKKPLDFVELFENKLSGLVASTLFVPVITWQMIENFGPVAGLGSLPDGVQLASVWPAILPTWDPRWVLIPASLLSFFTVWLTAHVINVLVAICPIGFIDTLLKLLKNGVLGVLMIASAVHPYLGAAFSGCLILFAFLVAGAACRFTVFGTTLALDALRIWRKPRDLGSGPARAFTAQRIGGVPARTLGHLVREADGSYAFAYRSWFVLPKRTVRLPTGQPLLHRDVLTVSLVVRSESGHERRLLEFPPRYRRQWETLAAFYAVSEVRDGRLAGGLSAAWSWIRQLFGMRNAPTQAPAGAPGA